MSDVKPAPALEVVLPVFPLPDLVVFPGVRVPLHIFEPRYRRMTEDVLAGNRKLAIAVLEPGFEADYFAAPPICPLVATCLIESSRRLPDGRFLLGLVGEGRGRIVSELARADYPYRRARVALRPADVPPPALVPAVARMRQFLGRLRAAGADLAESSLESEEPAEDEGSPGRALDWVHLTASSLPLATDCKLELLGIDDPMARARALEHELERLAQWQGVMARHRPPAHDLRRN